MTLIKIQTTTWSAKSLGELFTFFIYSFRVKSMQLILPLEFRIQLVLTLGVILCLVFLLPCQLADQLLLIFFFFSLCSASVMVAQESSALDALCWRVGKVTCKKEHVSGLDLPGESHEDTRVKDEGLNKITNVSVIIAVVCKNHFLTSRHRAWDDLWVFLDIHKTSNRDPPVCYRSPEVSTGIEVVGSG